MPVPDSPVSEAHAGRESGGYAGPVSNDVIQAVLDEGPGTRASCSAPRVPPPTPQSTNQ